MSSVRVVRPRPLNVDEKIPVYWAGREVPPSLKQIDGGALYDYLLAQTPKQSRKRRRGNTYKAPKEVSQPC